MTEITKKEEKRKLISASFSIFEDQLDKLEEEGYTRSKVVRDVLDIYLGDADKNVSVKTRFKKLYCKHKKEIESNEAEKPE